MLWGNAYAQIIRNGRGEVIALYPLMPDRMAVDRDSNGQLYYENTTSADDGVRQYPRSRQTASGFLQ